MALLPIFCVLAPRTDLSMLVARALKIGKKRQRRHASYL
jgi:hypothetical protein